MGAGPPEAMKAFGPIPSASRGRPRVSGAPNARGRKIPEDAGAAADSAAVSEGDVKRVVDDLGAPMTDRRLAKFGGDEPDTE